MAQITPAPALVQGLALLLQSEQDLPATTSALRARVAGSSSAAEIDDVIAAILVARFSGRSIQELCAMGGISLDDFTQSVVGFPQNHGQVNRRHAMTLRLSTDDQSNQDKAPVHGAAEAGSH